MSISDTGVWIFGRATNQFVPFDTTNGFHSYLLTSAGGTGTFNLSIDGVVKATAAEPWGNSLVSDSVFSFGSTRKQVDLGPAKVDFMFIHYAN